MASITGIVAYGAYLPFWRLPREVVSAAKLEYLPITRVENFCSGGLTALGNACFAVASDAYDMALACGVEKLKDLPPTINWSTADPLNSSKAVIDPRPPICSLSSQSGIFFVVAGISRKANN
jgi:acetyl-CoA acetyltransferase